MSFVAAILTSITLLPAVQAVDGVPEATSVARQVMDGAATENGSPAAQLAASETRPEGASRDWVVLYVSRSFLPESSNQVRIEQRMTIRVSPRRAPVRPNSFSEFPEEAFGPRYVERRIGKCLPVSRIAGVEANGGRNLILYLNDRRIVSADLERTCRARDFYSGFYLSKSTDGKLCIDRDELQSRSGANCKLKRMRELIEIRE